MRLDDLVSEPDIGFDFKKIALVVHHGSSLGGVAVVVHKSVFKFDGFLLRLPSACPFRPAGIIETYTRPTEIADSSRL